MEGIEIKRLLTAECLDFQRFVLSKKTELERLNAEDRAKGVPYAERKQKYARLQAADRTLEKVTTAIHKLRNITYSFYDIILEGEEELYTKWGMQKYIRYTWMQILGIV